jgi:hypothetical protein
VQQPKLKVSFLIDAAELGAFVHQYADKVQALDIGAIEGVAWNKNKPAEKRKTKGLGLPRDEAIAVVKKMRGDILTILKKGPLQTREICAKFKDVPKHPIYQLLNRMQVQRMIVRNEHGAFKLPTNTSAKKPAPRAVPKNFKLGKPKKKPFDFSAAGRKGAEAKKRNEQKKKLNGNGNPSVPTTEGN